MKKMFKDKRFILLYIIVVLFLVIGFTYAVTEESLTFNINTATVEVDTNVYGAEDFDASDLELTPILDSEVGTEEKEDNVVKIDFTVGGTENNTNEHIIYDIALVDLEIDCSLLSPYMKWKLIKNGTEETWEGSFDYQFDTIVNGRLVLTTIQQELPKYDETFDDYTFYLWISDSCQEEDLANCQVNEQLIDQSNLMNKILNGKIEVELYTENPKELTRKPQTEIDYSVCKNVVTYEYNGGTGTKESDFINSGQTYGELPTPTKNYTLAYETNSSDSIDSQALVDTFDGWYLEENFVTLVTSETVVNETNSHTLYAKWIKDENSTVTLPELTEQAGYKFEGWYTDENFIFKAGDAGDTYVVDENTTFYAKWRTYQVMINYNANGGSWGQTTESSLSIDENGWVTKNGTKWSHSIVYGTSDNLKNWDATNWINVVNNGYVAKTGAEWCTSSDGTGTCYNDSTEYTSDDLCDASISDCTVNLYVNWNKLITITYDANGGTGTMEDTVYEYGQSEAVYLSANAFTKTNYTFKFWHMYDSTTDKWYGCTDDSVECSGAAENTTLGWYPESEIKLYYEPHGSSWILSSNAHPNDMIFYAQWELSSYTLTITSGAGGSVTVADTTKSTSATAASGKSTTLTVTSGDTIKVTATASTGYTLSTLKRGSTNMTSGGTFTASSSLTIAATWTANKYTVTLNNQSATTAGTTSVTATYGSAMPSITKPTKDSFTVSFYNYRTLAKSLTAKNTFGGYYTATGGGGTQYYTAAGASARTWNLTKNTTLYAKWTTASITAPAQTARTNRTSMGWYTTDANQTSEIDTGLTIVSTGGSYTPTKNINLYGRYRATATNVFTEAFYSTPGYRQLTASYCNSTTTGIVKFTNTSGGTAVNYCSTYSNSSTLTQLKQKYLVGTIATTRKYFVLVNYNDGAVFRTIWYTGSGGTSKRYCYRVYVAASYITKASTYSTAIANATYITMSSIKYYALYACNTGSAGYGAYASGGIYTLP